MDRNRRARLRLSKTYVYEIWSSRCPDRAKRIDFPLNLILTVTYLLILENKMKRFFAYALCSAVFMSGAMAQIRETPQMEA